MASTGLADYSNAHDDGYDIVSVPLKHATNVSLRDLGRIVTDFEREKVWLTPWPVQGHRPLLQGSGRGGGVMEEVSIYTWEGEYLRFADKHKPDEKYTVGRLPPKTDLNSRDFVLVREANYHPDGGQVFFPVGKQPFVALLAPPGDDVTAEDFLAFYFDGTCGLQIKADVWHQPLYPLASEAEFLGKQGAVHACVMVDTVNEFNTYLKVPLKPEYINESG